MYKSLHCQAIARGGLFGHERGEAANDVIEAGNGNNIIFAGAGNDNITVGNGNNYVDGGAGYDVCVPIDCCGSVDDASLRAGLAQFASAGIQEYTLAALLIALLGDFAMPIAPKILALVKTRGQNVARTFGD